MLARLVLIACLPLIQAQVWDDETTGLSKASRDWVARQKQTKSRQSCCGDADMLFCGSHRDRTHA